MLSARSGDPHRTRALGRCAAVGRRTGAVVRRLAPAASGVV